MEINSVVYRLLHTDLGIKFISILLGLGLATFFRKVCNDKSCIRFDGPVLKDFNDMNGKIYKHGDKCYLYEMKSTPCNEETKKIIPLSNKEEFTTASANQSKMNYGLFE
jgi:hypothetical protein